MLYHILCHLLMMLIVIVWLLIIGFLWKKVFRPKLVQGKNVKIICCWFLLHSPLTAFVLYFTGPFYYHIFVNPLPPDEKYIEIFKTHRADLETMIKAYYAAPAAYLWDHSPEMQKIKKRAGIYRIVENGYWKPDLYSVEAQRRLLQFDDVKTREGRFALRQHAALKIEIADSHHLVPTPRYLSSTLIDKSLLYIPTVPKTSNGKLWPPVSPPQSQDEYERSADRLLPSLTSYPDNWERDECVYRQLEPHWFIEMCRVGT
jgi:hypothetical protein